MKRIYRVIIGQRSYRIECGHAHTAIAIASRNMHRTEKWDVPKGETDEIYVERIT